MNETQRAATNEPQTKLNSKQKQAVWLLSIGTFLEYFDLMLYVHMAVILNDLFFPKVDDPQLKFIITAGAFCSTYIMMPFGALIFGYIGDKVGRRHTIIATTFMMALACIFMATLPTYKEIGVMATVGMIGCRMLQGMSSMGEVTGALVYLNEFIKAPAKYRAVAFIPFTCAVAFIVALGVANLVISFGMNWRIVFCIGAFIALVGAKARTSLKETPEFLDAKKKSKNVNQAANYNLNERQVNIDFCKQKSKNVVKDSIYLFILEVVSPACFYLNFFYCSNLLKVNFNYTSAMILNQNFILAIVSIIKYSSLLWLSSKFSPLSIVKYQLYILTIILIFSPLFLYAKTDLIILLFRSLLVMFILNVAIASSCIYEHFPVLKRFRAAILVRAIARSGMYIVTSFGLVYIVEKFGFISISLFFAILCAAAIVALRHFIKLHEEKASKTKAYPKATVF